MITTRGHQPLYLGLAIIILLALACGILPASGPEAEVKAAFEEWVQQAGVPYKNVSYQTIKNDGTFATVHVLATLRQSTTEDWLDKQADIECRHVGSQWQCASTFVFTLTEAEQARQRQIISSTATAVAIKAQATVTEYARQAEATRQALVATQAVVKQNSDATATAIALGATATALAPRPIVTSIPEPYEQTGTVTIDARRATWTETDIQVQKGDSIKIEASGIIDHGGALCGPDGNPNYPPSGNAVVPTARYGALVGTIGLGDPFIVGSRYQGVASQNGNLGFLINDGIGQYNDNSGYYQLTITVTGNR
jgi:hypothetical protein